MTTLDELRAAAVAQADAHAAGFVGSEHLFLAWLVTGEGAAHAALAAAGVTADAFNTMVAARRGPGRGAAGQPGTLSSHAERALVVAAEIAVADARSEATGDDVFLALIREPRGAIARALTEAKVKPSQLKALMRPGGGRPTKAPSASPPAPRREPQAAARRDPPPSPPRARRDPEIDDIPEPRPPERPRLVPPPRPAPLPPVRRRWSPLWILYLALPVSLWLRFAGADPAAVFVAACLAIVPLASTIANATDHLAERTGPMLGALLNAAFGNATEVIVAIAALRMGYVDLVKASLAGSILGNLLLILGLALLAGGLRQPILKFNRTAAGMSAAMLALAVAALILPSLVRGSAADEHLAALSQVIAAILAATYIASLLFTLRTHRRVFAAIDRPDRGERPWNVATAIAVLAVATVAVAVESELLVDTIGPVTQSFGLSQVFLGLIVIPVIGNAAEHASAIVAARRGKIELALQVALGSSTQVALLVAPLLVLVSALLGHGMNLVFPGFQVGVLAIAVIVCAVVTLDGESHWLEGVQLLALYAMIATAAWFI